MSESELLRYSYFAVNSSCRAPSSAVVKYGIPVNKKDSKFINISRNYARREKNLIQYTPSLNSLLKSKPLLQRKFIEDA